MIKVFSNGGRRGGVPPPTENLLILQPRNIAPVDFPQPKFNSPYLTQTKKQLLCYNPIQTSFLAVVIALVPILF